jgi:hypothetical protein
MKKIIIIFCLLFAFKIWAQGIPGAIGDITPTSVTIGGQAVNGKISGMIMATNAQAMISGNTILSLSSNVFLNGITAITNGFVLPKSGRYTAFAQIFADNTSAGNQMALYISKNGVGHAVDNQYAQGAGQQPVVKGQYTFTGVSNDFINCYVFRSQAGTTNWNYSAGTEAYLYIQSE